MHIAFVAMSGVRAFKPELNAMGMTLPGFVERGKVVASLPSLRLLTLAGMTPDRFEISYHESPTSTASAHCRRATLPRFRRLPRR